MFLWAPRKKKPTRCNTKSLSHLSAWLCCTQRGPLCSTAGSQHTTTGLGLLPGRYSSAGSCVLGGAPRSNPLPHVLTLCA